MATATYRCPTSDKDGGVVEQQVVRDTLIEIENGVDTITLECHSLVCGGKTIYAVNPGEDRYCPKCASLCGYPVGTYTLVDDPDGLDATDYGDAAHDATPDDYEETTVPDRKNGRDATGVRHGFDDHKMRADVCRRNDWNFAICSMIFDPPGAHQETVLSPAYMRELQERFGR